MFEDRLADVWVCEMEAYRDYTKFEKSLNANCLRSAVAVLLLQAAGTVIFTLPIPSAGKKWIDTIFAEQPYLSNVYPGDTRNLAGIVFRIMDAQIEYFNLGVNPIFRENYTIGDGHISLKGYQITDACIRVRKLLYGMSRKGNRKTIILILFLIPLIVTRQSG